MGWRGLVAAAFAVVALGGCSAAPLPDDAMARHTVSARVTDGGARASLEVGYGHGVIAGPFEVDLGKADARVARAPIVVWSHEGYGGVLLKVGAPVERPGASGTSTGPLTLEEARHAVIFESTFRPDWFVVHLPPGGARVVGEDGHVWLDEKLARGGSLEKGEGDGAGTTFLEVVGGVLGGVGGVLLVGAVVGTAPIWIVAGVIYVASGHSLSLGMLGV